LESKILSISSIITSFDVNATLVVTFREFGIKKTVGRNAAANSWLATHPGRRRNIDKLANRAQLEVTSRKEKEVGGFLEAAQPPAMKEQGATR
jgi:hypothetical protein